MFNKFDLLIASCVLVNMNRKGSDVFPCMAIRPPQ